MQAEHDLVFCKHGFIPVFHFWQIRVDERNDEVDRSFKTLGVGIALPALTSPRRHARRRPGPHYHYREHDPGRHLNQLPNFSCDTNWVGNTYNDFVVTSKIVRGEFWNLLPRQFGQ